jgi:hypothetical protein
VGALSEGRIANGRISFVRTLRTHAEAWRGTLQDGTMGTLTATVETREQDTCRIGVEPGP